MKFGQLIEYNMRHTYDEEKNVTKKKKAASTAADNDQIRVETCTDPCGLDRSDEAASTAAADDQKKLFPDPFLRDQNRVYL